MLTLAVMAVLLLWHRQVRKRRIRLLAQRLAPFNIERLMEQLADGYLRCLGEADAERREQLWQWLEDAEQQLARQFARFAAEFATVDRSRTAFVRGATAGAGWPVALLDLRELFAVHARGIARTIENAAGRSRRDKAFMLCAEMYLMQHSCHWFCRSHLVASARLLRLHQTSYAQVLSAVSEPTRRDYARAVGLRALPAQKG